MLNNRITGIFCGCQIFVEFCRAIETAEIKNRKIFPSRYNDKILSVVSVQSRLFLCLSGIVYNAVYTVFYCTPGYDTVIYIAHSISVLSLPAIIIFHGNYAF